jgi:hypothetical protein
MNRGIWIAVALLAAAPVHGQDQAKKDSTGAKATTAPKQGAKKGGGKDAKAAPKQQEAGGSAAWGTGTPGKEPDSAARKQSAAPASAKNSAARGAMLRLRSTYRYAVESCEQAGKDCDGTLRGDAERRFMDACLECTTREKCEAERDVIRTGESKSQTTLCAE